MNHHLRAHLIATGRLDPTGHNRALTALTCRTCGQLVASALDGDHLALTATVDPDPINPLGELLALATGRRTYDVLHDRNRLTLEIRRPAHIATPRRYPVVADHTCHSPLPTEDPTAYDPPPLPDAPPF